MLILTRYKEQVIKVGDDVDVKILSIKGNQVSIGIEAPDDVSIHREEVYDQISDKKAEK